MSKTNAEKQDSTSVAGGSDTGFSSVFNDPKGTPASGTDFNTNFGTENTAMGDIFKAGSSQADDKKKRLIFLGAAGAALIICVGGLMYLLQGEPNEEAAIPPAASVQKPDQIKAPPMAKTKNNSAITSGEAVGDDEVTDETDDTAAATNDTAANPIAATASTTYTYNERDGGPVVSAADGTVVEVSRKADFSVPYVTGKAKAGKFRIPNPPPGEIYWRQQGSAAQKITISPAQPLNLTFSAPASVASGESLSWSSNGSVAFYRLEFATDASFANIASVLATAKTSVGVKEVAAGKYQVRLAGFNTAAGRWEYSNPSTLEIK